MSDDYRGRTNLELLNEAWIKIPGPGFRGRLWTRAVEEMDQHPAQSVIADVDGVVKFGENYIYAFGVRCGEYADDSRQLVIIPYDRFLHFESDGYSSE